MIIDKKSIRL